MEKINNYTPMRWVKAVDLLPQHMVRHALKINGVYYGGYYDYSIKAFMCANMGPSGVRIKDVEWLDESTIPLYEQHFKMLEALKLCRSVFSALLDHNEDYYKQVEQTIKECEL